MCPMLLPAHARRQAKPRATHYRQVGDVAEWLAEMGRRADWMSGGSNFGNPVAILREKWDTLEITKPEEVDRIAARKQRLVTLFGSDDCYSANLHANTNNLGEFIHSLVRLDRLPTHTPPEGLRLLAQAWDEHRGKFKETIISSREMRQSRSSSVAALEVLEQLNWPPGAALEVLANNQPLRGPCLG